MSFFVRIKGCICKQYAKQSFPFGCDIAWTLSQHLAIFATRNSVTGKTYTLDKICNNFDNVKGCFPIGFFIYDTEKVEVFDNINADVFDAFTQFSCISSTISLIEIVFFILMLLKIV